MLKAALISTFSLAFTISANAQHVEPAPAQGWWMMSTTDFVVVNNWQSLKTDILNSWSSTTPARILPSDAPPAGSLDGGRAFLAEHAEIDILSFHSAPEDAGIFQRLGALFPSVTDQMLHEFNDGLVIESVAISGSGFALQAYFLTDQVQDTSVSSSRLLLEQLRQLAPGSQLILNMNEGNTVQTSFILRDQRGTDFLEGSAIFLESKGFATQLIRSPTGQGMIVMADTDTSQAVVQITSSGADATVLISVGTFD